MTWCFTFYPSIFTRNLTKIFVWLYICLCTFRPLSRFTQKSTVIFLSLLYFYPPFSTYKMYIVTWTLVLTFKHISQVLFPVSVTWSFCLVPFTYNKIYTNFTNVLFQLILFLLSKTELLLSIVLRLFYYLLHYSTR